MRAFMRAFMRALMNALMRDSDIIERRFLTPNYGSLEPHDTQSLLLYSNSNKKITVLQPSCLPILVIAQNGREKLTEWNIGVML